MATNDLETRFKYVLALFHETLCGVMKVLSLKHPHHKSLSKDSNIALSEILQAVKNIEKIIRSINYPQNHSKIFQNNKIKPTIDIDNLDVTILVDIALKIQDFLTNRYIEKLKKVPCTSALHGTIKCCNNCCHDCQICGQRRCKRKCCTPPNSECSHTCIHCPENDKDCRHKLVVCCKQCQICIYCMSTQPKCIYLKLRESIKGFKVLRNIYAHTTGQQYQEFEINKYTFEDYPHCTDWFDIWDTLDKHLNSCLDYLEQEQFISSDTKHDRAIAMQIIRNDSINNLENQFSDYFSDVIILISKEDCAMKEDIKLLAETITSAQAGELSLLFMLFMYLCVFLPFLIFKN